MTGVQGAAVRNEVSLTSDLVGVLDRGRVIYIDYNSGNRVHLAAPLVGWASVIATDGISVLLVERDKIKTVCSSCTFRFYH